jgi:hypothetical protein
MKIEKNKLDTLYKKYGFNVLDEGGLVRIYLFERGRYFGADIVQMDTSNKASAAATELKKSYSNLGYAARIREYESFENAEIELYKSFFAYETTSNRIKAKYEKFRDNQKKLNGGTPYEYVNSPFEINNKSSQEGDIISNINEVLALENAQLVIIEAAAGYGKTCTAYEILNSLIKSENCENPLLTELARNRGAKIFRYILLDEIDREYPSLNSDLVKYEIQTGRIPLIIDGFDELLSKSDLVKSDKDDLFEEIETMLDTIGNLLIGKAKIILTTRKTAIFSGAEFDYWLKKWENTFNVTRFSIREPRIKDWLGNQRLKIIKSRDIPVEYVANPVLLTYLRGLSDEDFVQHADEPESFVEKYFLSLLSREMERQELLMVPEDQYAIFRNVVQLMIELDSSAESGSFMKEMIFEQNKDKIQRTLDLYPSSSRPTVDNLLDKLSKHALLDRKGHDDMVGFINDFVFGTFIGEIMSKSTSEKIEKDFSSYMVEIGATAYRVQNKVNKELLWNKIESLNHKFESRSILALDLSLRGGVLRDFENSIFQSISAFKIHFDAKFGFRSCVFINCKFKNCVLDPNAFFGTSFIQCHFENCSVVGDGLLDNHSEILTIKCTEEDCLILSSNKYETEEGINYSDIEDDILRIIWQNDSKYKSQKYLKLMSNFEKSEQKAVSKVISGLEDQGLIQVKGLNIFLQINRIKEIERRLKGLIS